MTDQWVRLSCDVGGSPAVRSTHGGRLGRRRTHGHPWGRCRVEPRFDPVRMRQSGLACCLRLSLEQFSFQLPVTLVTCAGGFVSASPAGSDVSIAPGRAFGTGAIWGVVVLGENRWALRGSHGLYLSPRIGGEVVADASTCGDREILGVVHLGEGRIALRTAYGTYLTRGRGEGVGLLADAPSPGIRETFVLDNPFARIAGDEPARGVAPRKPPFR
jgi:hypothetical protein